MQKIVVGTKGKSFTLNGQRTQLLMATSFGWLGILRAAQGPKARMWLKRMKAIGMHGIRVFGEYADWESNPFFSKVWPLYDTWDWSKKGSGIQVTNRNARILRRAVELLREEGMIMEYVVSATAKAMPLSPGYQDHMCRAIAQFFESEWPEGDHNTYFEISNEYDVTRQAQLTKTEINEIARRWRVSRPEKGGVPDNPGAILSISEGGEAGAGKWNIKYPTSNLTHINIHSPRGKGWEVVGPDIKVFKEKYKKPICLNENMHYMTKEQWAEWVNPKWPSLASLSTKNAKLVLKQCQNARSAGAAVYTLHFMTGMLTDPDLPITQVEREFAAVYGTTVPVPIPIPGPTPDPIPDPDPDPRHTHPEIEARLDRLEKKVRKLMGKITPEPSDPPPDKPDPIDPRDDDEDLYFIEWKLRRDNKFNRASRLHLGQTTVEAAIMSLGQLLLWNGVRNPQAALAACPFEEWRGISRQSILNRIRAAGEALRIMDSYVQLTTGNREKDGTSPDGGVRPHIIGRGSFTTPNSKWPGRVTAKKANWFKDLEEIILHAAYRAADLDGIRAMVKNDCVDPSAD